MDGCAGRRRAPRPVRWPRQLPAVHPGRRVPTVAGPRGRGRRGPARRAHGVPPRAVARARRHPRGGHDRGVRSAAADARRPRADGRPAAHRHGRQRPARPRRSAGARRPDRRDPTGRRLTAGGRRRVRPAHRPLRGPARLRVLPTGDGVGVLVAQRLGAVRTRLGTDFGLEPYVEITGGGLGDVTVVAFHAASPVQGRMAAWRADLALLSRWCAGHGRAVIAGDLNATLDHSALRAGSAGCTDAGAARGDGLVPTWGPTSASRVFGPQIDHVLATEGITPSTFDVRDLPGSDHRVVVSTLLVR
ncbi:endonuclease/exonuclease/phosphatase family protein [Pseudonocardia sp. CA-107938]|uniref:endonuclease/exonuclease/phosphatase family protein n=1 Tax=Pseudonocardia sp. CA-107938 TaxID=3240021 RepID=UPI003D90249F